MVEFFPFPIFSALIVVAYYYVILSIIVGRLFVVGMSEFLFPGRDFVVANWPLDR